MNKNKRADRRTGGFFPELERPKDERTAVKRRSIPWTGAADAVCVAAICVCRSQSAYSLMAPHLLDALGHEPIYGENANPSPAKHLDNCIRALELRIVTTMLATRREYQLPPMAGFWVRFRTPDSPLNWGECVKVLRPYQRKLQEQKPCMVLRDVAQMIGRSEEQVQDYIKKITQNPDFVDLEEICEPPVNGETADELGRLSDDLDYLFSGETMLESRDLELNIMDAFVRIWKHIRGI